MMPNDFTNDKAKKIFRKLWIKFSSRRKLAETGDLLRLSPGVRRWQVVPSLQDSNLLGTPESLRQHVDDRGIYIIDTVTYVLKLGHGGGGTDISQFMIRLFDRRHDCSKQVHLRGRQLATIRCGVILWV
jgi:hypothetical protein